MKFTAILFLSVFFLACSGPSGTTIEVHYAGALKNIMKDGDTKTVIALDSLRDKKHLYALGAFTKLKGEILIMDGKPLNTYVIGNRVTFDRSFNNEATLLVYSQVDQWKDFPINPGIRTMSQLEEFIKTTAEEYGINTSAPFPFLVFGTALALDWHVINWPDDDTEHSHKKHITSGPHGTFNNVKTEVLGFYSTDHKGIFTHHTSHMHLHANVLIHEIAGHVDDITLGSGCVLRLPLIL